MWVVSLRHCARAAQLLSKELLRYQTVCETVFKLIGLRFELQISRSRGQRVTVRPIDWLFKIYVDQMHHSCYVFKTNQDIFLLQSLKKICVEVLLVESRMNHLACMPSVARQHKEAKSGLKALLCIATLHVQKQLNVSLTSNYELDYD